VISHKPAILLEDDLRALLNPDLVSTADEVRAYYAQDAYWPGRAQAPSLPSDTRPDIVVWPRSTEDVVAVVRYAAARGVPIVPWGGGTGLMGAAIPMSGGIVLDLARHMNAVLAVDRPGQTATVQAGILLGDLDRALEPHGLMVGHDPYSRPIASVGGTISTSSVGYGAARYGPMADQVLAVEVVLGDGTVVRTRSVAKAAGPPLHRLWAGAEGTLGIVTEATLRVFPQPEERAYHAYRFPTFVAGFEAVTEMYDLGLRPALLDYGSDTDWSPPPESAFTLPLDEEPCELLLVFEGFAEAVAAEEGRALAILRAKGGRRLSGRRAKDYWERRHSSAERFRVNRAGGQRGWGARPSNRRSDTLHMALPVSAVRGFHEEVHRLAEAHRVHLRECAVWTHPGLFSIILATEADEPGAAAEKVRRAADAVLERAQDLGGSMEYVHGIGVRLLHLTEREFGSTGELLRRLKAAVDPANILNPGKLGFP